MNTFVVLCFAALLGVPLCAAPTTDTIAPDLAGMPSELGWKLVNRAAQSIERDGADWGTYDAIYSRPRSSAPSTGRPPRRSALRNP